MSWLFEIVPKTELFNYPTSPSYGIGLPTLPSNLTEVVPGSCYIKLYEQANRLRVGTPRGWGVGGLGWRPHTTRKRAD